MRKDKLLLKITILNEIFNIAPKRFQEKNLDERILTKRLNISEKELKDNIDFLVETGLIQRFPGANYKQDKIFDWLITDKGIDYLEKKHSEGRQLEFNKTIALTGAIIAIVTFYNFLIIILSENYKIILSILFFLPLVLCFVPIINFFENPKKYEIEFNKSLEEMKKSFEQFQREKKVGRNDPCPCGSGKKYKKCCLDKEVLK